MVHCLNPIYLVVLGLIEAYGWCIGEAGAVLYRVGVPLPTSTLSTVPSEVLLLAFILPLNQETPQEKGSWNLLLGTHPVLFLKRNKSAKVSYWDFILLLKKKKERHPHTCGQLIYDKRARMYSGEKTVTSISDAGENVKQQDFLLHTIYKNKLKMDWKPKCKTPNHKTPRREHRQYILWHKL